MCLPGLLGGGNAPSPAAPPPMAPPAPQPTAQPAVSGTTRRNRQNGSATPGVSLTIPSPINVP